MESAVFITPTKNKTTHTHTKPHKNQTAVNEGKYPWEDSREYLRSYSSTIKQKMENFHAEMFAREIGSAETSGDR